MPTTSLSVTATYDDGVLRPDQPLPLVPRQKVTLFLEVPASTDPWGRNWGDSDERDAAARDESALAEAIDLDLPTPIEMPRKRPLTLLDPDAAIDAEA